MTLKYATKRLGEIKYLGRPVSILMYDNEKDLLAEFNQLGSNLGVTNIAWVGQKLLIYLNEVVGETAFNGEITWYDKPKKWLASGKVVSRSKHREAGIIEDSIQEGIKDLWESAVRTNWEDIMLKSEV